MKRIQFTEEQVIGVLREAEANALLGRYQMKAIDPLLAQRTASRPPPRFQVIHVRQILCQPCALI